MLYKVFFVEDEIVTREGIRDSVDWTGNGFEFCGEAPDGEIALPLLQATQPDVLITDVEMPFMDGLQLTKIVRERMPRVKIIILSGHDEFDYAQAAIKFGVTEYLLKPVTVQDLHVVLQKTAALLDRERRGQEDHHKLQEQLAANEAIFQERLLLKLAMGTISASEAISAADQLGLELAARCYLVAVIKIQRREPSAQLDFQEQLRVQQSISRLLEKNPDVYLLRQDPEELILMLKGNTPEYLQEECDLLLKQIERQVSETRYKLTVGTGTPKERLSDISQSFVEALVTIRTEADKNEPDPFSRIDQAEWLKVDKSAVENYLKRGTREELPFFIDAYIQPLSAEASRWRMLRNYVLTDIILATAKFVSELEGNVEQVIPDLHCIERVLANITTAEQIKAQVVKILSSALAFRDSKTSHQYLGMIQHAKEFIGSHHMDPDILLDKVAGHVNLSPCHFSAVFSQETGTTFKEYLTELRINSAKELLRTTSLRSSEISERVGYHDPHYFSYVFRKNAGLSPKEFRLQTQAA
jgi:two-component system, response regulator YesN